MAKPLEKRTLAVNAFVLAGLAGLNWALAYVPLGRWNVLVALGVAGVMDLLLALFFMHLIRERGGVRIAAATAPLFIALLTGLLAADVLTR